jgi:toxin ParE1/3/4
MNVIWSPYATERVIVIARRIAENNPAAAERWLNGAFDKTKALADFPSMGRIVPEFSDPDTREIIYGDYRIIYRYDQEKAEILTVRHGKQLLSEDEI